MKTNRNPVSVFVLSVLLLTAFSKSAQADATLGDSALTVAFSTLGGAVLGTSTLPFYEEPGDHTKNIFYGAAFGAMVGVMISAYSGVKEGPNYEDEDAANLLKRKPTELSVNEAPELRFHSELTTATKKPPSFGGTILIWSPVASIRF